MAAKIQAQIPGSNVALIGGGKGDFIVIADGQKLWDKNGKDGSFPDEDALVARMAG